MDICLLPVSPSQKVLRETTLYISLAAWELEHLQDKFLEGESVGRRSRAFVLLSENGCYTSSFSQQQENVCLCPHTFAENVLLNWYLHRRWRLCEINLHLSYLSAVVQVFPCLRDISVVCYYELPVHSHCTLFLNGSLIFFLLFTGALNTVRNLVLYLGYELWLFFSSLSFVFWLFLVGDGFCHAD